MQSTPLSLLAAALVAVISSFVVVSFQGPDTAPEVSSDAEILARIESRLDDFESRLTEASARGLAASNRAAGSDEGPATSTKATGKKKSALEESNSVPLVAAANAAAEELGEGEPLREYIAQVIQSERKERRRVAEAKQQEMMREQKEMREGPWGRHNYKVNSLAKKLDFDDRQKQFYFDTLIHYSDMLKERRKRVDWKNKDAMKEFHTVRKDLHAEFENAVAGGLNAEQAEAFRDLPEWERRPDGGSAWMTTSISPANLSGDTPSIIAEHISGELRTATEAIITGGNVDGGSFEIRTLEATVDGSPDEK